jgi:hypothetical protein
MTKQEFDSIRERWLALCKKVLLRYNQASSWMQWFEYNYSDVITTDEIIPVHGIVNVSERRGASFHFRNTDEGGEVFTAYAKTSLSHENIAYLSIICDSTEVSFKQAEKLLDFWISNDGNVDAMNVFIDKELKISSKTLAMRRTALKSQKRFEKS